MISPHQLLILGGHDGSVYKNTITIFNLSANRFEERQHSGMPPSKRAYHTALLWQGKVILIGGYDGKNHYEDTWILHVGMMPELMVL